MTYLHLAPVLIVFVLILWWLHRRTDTPDPHEQAYGDVPSVDRKGGRS